MNPRGRVAAAIALLLLIPAAALLAGPGGDGRPTDLPPEARGFAGTLGGFVLAKADGQFVLAVREVTKVLPHSKAADPEKLVGREVRVAPPAEGENTKLMLRYIESLALEEKVEVDVTAPSDAPDGANAHEVLTLATLTEEQRRRAR